MTQSLLAAVEEQWLLPTYASSRSGIWIAAHTCLTLPFRIRGPVQWYRTAETEEPLTLLTVGASRRLRNFGERLFGGLRDTTKGRPRAIWSPDALGGVSDDIVIAEVHRSVAGRFRRAGWYTVPDAVRWFGELSNMPPAPPSKSLRDDLRKVRQRQYHLETATTTADWEEFYATMLVPHVEQRFGDSAWIPSPRLRRVLQKRGVLHFVCRQEVRVGGVCMVPSEQEEKVWIPLVGVLAGDETLLREGALAAVYGLGIEWAKANGYRYIDKGRTSPFLNDGIGIYKRKWGLAPVRDPLSHLFAIRFGPKVQAGEVFARTPVMMETGDGVVPVFGTPD